MLIETLNISKDDYKKYAPKNALFTEFKKKLFLELLDHYKIETNQIINLLNDPNPEYKSLKDGYNSMEKLLKNSPINTYYFLSSLIPEKSTRKKLRLSL